MQSIRAAFVMEHTLGHVTHAQNLRRALAEQSALVPTWLPISFRTSRAESLVPLLRSNWSVRASWRARRALGTALASQRHDALFFHTQVTSLFSVGLMHQYPSIVSLDATPINYDSVGQAYGHRPAGDGFLDRRKFELNRRALHAAAGLVVWTDWGRRSLIGDYGVPAERIQVVAPGAAAAYFDIGARRLGPAADQGQLPRVLFVGGDFARKGGPELLEVARELHGQCHVDLVTNDPLAVASPNVRVHRQVGPNSPALLGLFASADLFVLPSHAECLALVLQEATAAGLPVITTAVGGLSEAVTPGLSGLVVPPGDARELGAALQRLLSDARLRRRMGRAGYALAERKFRAETNNRVLLDLVVAAAAGDARERTA